MRQVWAGENADSMARLVRALARGADMVEDVNHRDEVCRLLAAPNRIGVAAEVIRRTLDGRLVVSPDGATRTSSRYLGVGNQGAARPDPTHAAWFYAQMVRWGQAPLSPDLLASAKAVFRPDLFDQIVGPRAVPAASLPPDHIGAFAGPAFDPDDLRSYLTAWAKNPV
jgi:NitT/TauT family transport system ATP-binding protein